MSDTSSWDALVTDEDRAASAAAGFGGPTGLGQRPGLLIIDMQYRTTGTTRVPMLEAMKEFPTSCGDRAWAAADRVKPLLALFRDKGWPVLYPHVAPKVSSETGRLAAKVSTMWDVPAKGYEFFAPLAPRPQDILVPKKHPSAFFGTSLVSHLVDLGVDTLVMVGCTTSGCIRASVVDAFSYNYHVVVPSDCVYDRGDVSHRINLFDMSQKYADVLPSSQLIAALQEVPAATP
ncbi:MAG: isochorismatase family protein [Comamonadaceae bacterium]|nr:MAG: isochorismatase family protein [Comamonadaceae bacterium]